MNACMRWSFRWALAFSLLLHLGALTVSGWTLPVADAVTTPLPLAATLLMPSPVKPAPPPAASRVPTLRPATARQPTARPSLPTAVAHTVSPAVDSAITPAVDPIFQAADDALPAVEAAAEPERPASVPPAELPTRLPSDSAADAPSAVTPAPTFATPLAATWPPRGRIRFSVTRGASGFIVGQAEHNWQHDGTTYRLRAVTETTGLAAVFKPVTVVQESRGIFVASGLQPRAFKNERDSRLTLALHFDLQQRIVFHSGRSNRSDHSAALTEATQDMLSLFYQLALAPHTGSEFFLSVATGRKLERYALTVGATQSLDTPFGVRTVQHYTLPGTQGGASSDATEIWLDSQTRLPLKIRHRDRKGDIYDQTATAVELDPTLDPIE